MDSINCSNFNRCEGCPIENSGKCPEEDNVKAGTKSTDGMIMTRGGLPSKETLLDILKAKGLIEPCEDPDCKCHESGPTFLGMMDGKGNFQGPPGGQEIIESIMKGGFIGGSGLPPMDLSGSMGTSSSDEPPQFVKDMLEDLMGGKLPTNLPPPPPGLFSKLLADGFFTGEKTPPDRSNRVAGASEDRVEGVELDVSIKDPRTWN